MGRLLGIPARIVRAIGTGVLLVVRGSASVTGLLRVGMDTKSGDAAVGCDAGRAFATADEAVAFFDARFAAAQHFAKHHGLGPLGVYAKLVSADKLILCRRSVVEHAEWQLWFLPDPMGLRPASDGTVAMGEMAAKGLPGWLNEDEMTARVGDLVRLNPKAWLRSGDNPLFGGRLNLGTSGAGLFARVPEYAEVDGQRRDSRAVVWMVRLGDPDRGGRRRARHAIRHLYAVLPGPWGENGVCHQGAVATADGLGLDGNLAAALISGLWTTRIKYGRRGLVMPEPPSISCLTLPELSSRGLSYDPDCLFGLVAKAPEEAPDSR